MKDLKLDYRTGIKLSKNTLDEIDKLSNRIGCTRSNVIRMAIAYFLKNWEERV